VGKYTICMRERRPRSLYVWGRRLAGQAVGQARTVVAARGCPAEARIVTAIAAMHGSILQCILSDRWSFSGHYPLYQRTYSLKRARALAPFSRSSYHDHIFKRSCTRAGWRQRI